MRDREYNRHIMKKMILVAMTVLCAVSLNARKVSILGDSYSTFQGCVQPETNESWYFPGDPAEKTDVTSPELTWWRIFLERTGWELERNNSYSGATICNRGYDGADYSHRAFTHRVFDLGDPDIILVFGATNDYWSHAAITPEESAEPLPHPFYAFAPAMDYLLQQLGALYPRAEAVFMLNDEIKGPLREKILEQCAARGVRCLELHDVEKRMGHPDAAGMRAIADQLIRFLPAESK